MKKVSKKTAYNIKKASDQKLTASARKHYAENAEAAMKDKKSPTRQMAKPAPKATAKAKPAPMMKKASAAKMKKC